MSRIEAVWLVLTLIAITVAAATLAYFDHLGGAVVEASGLTFAVAVLVEESW